MHPNVYTTIYISQNMENNLHAQLNNDCLKKIIMQYHSIIENSEILLIIPAIWMDLENIIYYEVC